MHARVFEHVDRDLSLRIISIRAFYRGRKGKIVGSLAIDVIFSLPLTMVSVYKETGIALAKDKRVYAISRARF